MNTAQLTFHYIDETSRKKKIFFTLFIVWFMANANIFEQFYLDEVASMKCSDREEERMRENVDKNFI